MYVAFETSVNKILSMVYFILWIFTGNFVLLNLILAILLDGTFVRQGSDWGRRWTTRRSGANWSKVLN